jgi:hypothetical protein
MICAPDSPGSASKIMKFVTSISQTSSGMRINVIPGHRSEMVVAITLMADTVLPILVSSRLRIQ